MSVIVHQVTNTARTSANGQVTALTDRKWYDFLIGQQTGVASGCAVATTSGLGMTISAGWGIIQGCLFTIGAETITATASTSGTVDGRLLLHIDTATGQGQLTTQASTPLPALTQEDINTNGTVYELPLATYDVSTTTVSNLQNVAPSVSALMALITALQTGKQDAITGSGTTITSTTLTTSRALITNSSGKIAVSNTTSTELGYVHNVTSAIQTQLNAKVPNTTTVNGHALSSNVTVTKSDLSLGNVTNDKQMPIAGGTFTGTAKAKSENNNTNRIRNIVVQTSGGTATSTDYIIMRRK